MSTRKLSIVIGIIIFIAAIFLFKILSAGAINENETIINIDTAIGVPIIVANPKTITSDIYFTGRVIPKDQLQLFSEVSGTLSSGIKPFKSGNSFKKGETIFKIDDREQKQLVLSQKSQFQSLLAQVLADISVDFPDEYKAWNTYLSDMNINHSLKELPISTNKKFNLFMVGRGINASFYGIKQSEARLSKFTINAPFDGVLTENLINEGTLVRANQQVGEFIRTGVYEIEASINASDKKFIKPGDQVSIKLDDLEKSELSAKVARINSKIDPTTQTILTFLEVNTSDLLSGQYITGSISGQTFDNAQKIASKSLVRNNKVFLSRNSIATLSPVSVLATTKDSVIVRGLVAGDLVIDEFRDAAFEGREVTALINNRD